MNGTKYASAEAFRAALEARAKKLAKETNQDGDMVRRMLAFQAFLRRVPASGQSLILKGGYLLHLRYGTGVRPTRDIDAAIDDVALNQPIDPKDAERRMRDILERVASTGLGDFFSFQIVKSMADLGTGREFVGFRFSVEARVGARLFDSFHVDCTAGDALISPFDTMLIGADLAFAGMESTEVKAIRPEQHFAEKLHAYCRDRGEKTNSRVKDLFDMVLFIQKGIALESVAQVLPIVFDICGKTPIPVKLAPPPMSWKVPFEEMAKENGMATTVEEAFHIVSIFFSDVCQAMGQMP